jgi:hypothetical protein
LERIPLQSPYIGFEVVVLLNDYSIFEGKIIEASSDGETIIALQNGRIVSGANCVFRLKDDIPPTGDLFDVFFN